MPQLCLRRGPVAKCGTGCSAGYRFPWIARPAGLPGGGARSAHRVTGAPCGTRVRRRARVKDAPRRLRRPNANRTRPAVSRIAPARTRPLPRLSKPGLTDRHGKRGAQVPAGAPRESSGLRGESPIRRGSLNLPCSAGTGGCGRIPRLRDAPGLRVRHSVSQHEYTRVDRSPAPAARAPSRHETARFGTGESRNGNASGNTHPSRAQLGGSKDRRGWRVMAGYAGGVVDGEAGTGGTGAAATPLSAGHFRGGSVP